MYIMMDVRGFIAYELEREESSLASETLCTTSVAPYFVKCAVQSISLRLVGDDGLD